MLADARAFLLLAAGLTATGARGKRNGVLAGNKNSVSLPGLPGLPATLHPRPAGCTCVPGEATVAPGPGREHQPGITGLMLRENTRKRGIRHNPGLRVRCQRNPPCHSVLSSAAE